MNHSTNLRHFYTLQRTCSILKCVQTKNNLSIKYFYLQKWKEKWREKISKICRQKMDKLINRSCQTKIHKTTTSSVVDAHKDRERNRKRNEIQMKSSLMHAKWWRHFDAIWKLKSSLYVHFYQFIESRTKQDHSLSI